MINCKFFLTAVFLLLSVCYAQQKEKDKGILIDENGVMRWINSNKEVSLFGVNYTTPFAYSYRAQKKLGLSLKKSIDLDIEQMVRLGIDAFRVHVWDREISDKEGNILINEHLKLFDYLLSKLESKGIKIILTPIAWWGNGWPQPDEKTKGFSSFYSKIELITNKDARKAERNYLKQFVNHYNPFTKLIYKNDPSIIALEIVNEPFHPDSTKEVTDYINEMVNAIRSAGYSKPLFYNISQNWNNVQAQAVCNADIQGVSFQWYPTGLVHNKMLQGNYLINVNHYTIPSGSLTGFNDKAKMVYEFEAADIGGSYMYPAIVRSFREAGMQFATMFSYDPSQIAWSNTEYGTHFMNLLYTPNKTISMMIAAKAFHELPRYKSYGNYPVNNKFGNFKVDYDNDLSEMNSDTAFYYSNSTDDIPGNAEMIKHIAGCGNSSLIKYDGTGAYFLDKVKEGIWKLEVYPDCLWIRDPFKPASMSRQVARLYWENRKMSVSIPDLGNNFNIFSLSDDKGKKQISVESGFIIKPGIYLLVKNNSEITSINKYLSKKEKFLDGLYTPPSTDPSIVVINNSPKNLFYKTKQHFRFKIASDNKIDSALIFIRSLGWRGFEKYILKNTRGFNYEVNDSIKLLNPGKFEYCIVVKSNGVFYTFPGGIKGSPDDWDFYSPKFWKLNVLNPDENFVLFNAGRDMKDLVFPQFSNKMRYLVNYTNGTNNEETALFVKINFSNEAEIPFAVQFGPVKIIKPLKNNINDYKYFILRARSINNQNSLIQFNILTIDGRSYSKSITLKKDWQRIKISVDSLKYGSSLIMPFSYPQFLPKIWEPGYKNEGALNLSDINFIQFECDKNEVEENGTKHVSGFEIQSVTLEK